jgi:hypothetical protein
MKIGRLEGTSAVEHLTAIDPSQIINNTCQHTCFDDIPSLPTAEHWIDA